MRKPTDPVRMQTLANFEAVEFKDVSIGTGAAGGFAVPEEISRQIGLLERKFSPVRTLVNVVRASTSDYKMLVDKTGATSGWVGETGTRSGTATPTLRERVPTHGELYAYPTLNSLTAAAVRKLKDATGQYLWVQGLIDGQPDRLLGYPVAIWEDMPDIGAGNFPVFFGDFQRAYQLVDRTEMRITRDPYTTPGLVKFYVRRREGGHVWDNHALRVLQTT